jgi:hypothetical protein
MQLLFSVFDWFIIMISLGGYLLVGPHPHLFAIDISILGVGLQKSK